NGLWLICNDFSFQQFLPKKWQSAVGEFQVLDAASDEKGLFWLATTDGLWTFEAEKRFFSKREIPVTAGNVILQVLIGNENEIWLGTQNKGLLKLKEGHFEHFPYDSDNPYSLGDNRVQALLIDRFNNLWIGTMFGISRINFEQQKFPFYQIDPGPYRQDNFTFRMMQDSLGGFWFRLLHFGLGYAPGLGKELEILLQSKSSSVGEEIKNFCMDPEGNVWVLTFNNGLFKFERGKRKYNHINLCDSMKVAFTHTILSDRIAPQYLWISTRFGLCRMNRFTFDRKWFYPQDDLDWMDDNTLGPVEQSEDGKIWCTLRTKGINRIGYFDIVEEEFMAEPNQASHPSFVTFVSTRHIKSVPGNKVWVGIDNGVIIIDATNNTYTHLTEKDSLPVKSVESITPDLEGNIWFTGRNKICKYDGANYKCFDASDDIEHFIYWNAALGKDGRVTFGGSNGIYSFYPDEITFEPDTIKPQVYLTNFKVFNKKRQLGKAYELVKEITLPYEENVFTLEFAGLHFTQSENLRYKYILENFDKDTVETGSNERVATYTNLSPNTYTFKVWAAADDGPWTAEGDSLNIKLTVIPPWYRTWLAYCFYVLAICGLLFAIRHYEFRRQLTKVEALQLKELDNFKSRFYTNITHEFRTPLTAILGEAEWLRTRVGAFATQNINRIRRNGHQLLNLVNQILDLARLESGSLPLRNIQADIMLFTRYLVDSLGSLAESKGIDLSFSAEPEVYFMDFDPSKLRHIVVNLLSNAIKFTPADGKVQVEVKAGGETLKVKVSDSGKGIPKEELPKIFDRFYQAPPSLPEGGESWRSSYLRRTGEEAGTGIGLALTQELVKLMKGEISVKSEEGKGATFTVLLPVTKLEKVEEPDIEASVFIVPEQSTPDQPVISKPSNPDAPSLLIIEDSPDIVAYMVNLLKEDYQILSAPDGVKGVELAQKEVPDLIISDVMMPEMDGFEVCRRIKTEVATSHIPIILLTAKADLESRLEGLEYGADAYLSKPFEERELKIRLRKLLELRKRLQDKFRAPGNWQAEGGANTPKKQAGESLLFDLEQYSALDAAFIKKLKGLIEADYSVQWKVPELAKEMLVSPTQLYKKLKSITGMYPTEFVRYLRLMKATQLMQEHQDWNNTRIAIEVGFSSLSEFSNRFNELLGVRPTQWREGGKRL
ncbi:MAG: response regulator, partial [Phaeodactylibacter sp.]|nr:response regulator [Phaeodactylibacter sp.]